MESVEFLRAIMALFLVLGLMGGLWLILKKLGLNGPVQIPTGTKRRLKIVEVLPLDPRRKAIILRRDDTEHLVILSASGETVVESRFTAPPTTDSHDA